MRPIRNPRRRLAILPGWPRARVGSRPTATTHAAIPKEVDKQPTATGFGGAVAGLAVANPYEEEFAVLALPCREVDLVLLPDRCGKQTSNSGFLT